MPARGMTARHTHTTSRSTGPYLKDQDKAISPRQGNTQSDVDGIQSPRLPHERDESADSQHSEPREVIEQAHEDVQEGRQDTDKGPPLDDTYRKLKSS